MELYKRSDLTGKKSKLEEKEVLNVLNKYLKRIEILSKNNNYFKLMIPLNRINIERLRKLALKELKVDLEYTPVTTTENIFAVTVKKLKK